MGSAQDRMDMIDRLQAENRSLRARVADWVALRRRMAKLEGRIEFLRARVSNLERELEGK